jgi:hypothetical protein
MSALEHWSMPWPRLIVKSELIIDGTDIDLREKNLRRGDKEDGMPYPRWH